MILSKKNMKQIVKKTGSACIPSEIALVELDVHSETYLSLANGIAISGDVAYVATRSNRVVSIDISDPTNMTRLDFIDSSADLGGAKDIAIAGNIAYVVNYNTRTLASIDISDPSNMTIISSVPLSATTVYPIVLSGNVAYISGSSSMVSVDISDPNNMIVLHTYTSPFLDNSEGIAIAGNIAYVTSSPGRTITSVDISDPSNMIEIYSHKDTPALAGAKEITIAGNIAYVIADTVKAVTTIDISDPSNMVTVDTYSNAIFDGLGDIAIDRNTAYLVSTGKIISIGVC